MNRWIFFPPFFSFFLLILTLALRREGAATAVPPILWGLVIASYVCLCGLSVVYLIKRDTRFTAGISLLAQGVLLAAMSSQAGVVVFGWLGLISFLIGLLCVFLYATRGDEDAPEMPRKKRGGAYDDADGDRLLSKLGVPICYTDSTGVVEEATAMFLEAIERKPEEIIGTVISEIIPVDDRELHLPSGKWWLDIVQSGPRHYFYLHPTKDGKPAKETPQIRPQESSELTFLDPETGLYTNAYRKIRGPEEVSRAQRYKRPLSGLLLSLTFASSSSASGVHLSEEQLEMLRKAFAVKVKDILRTTDCGFWMDDHKQMQLLLPETAQAGAKTLMSRLRLLPQDVFDEDIRAAVAPKVRAVMSFYSGTSKLEYSAFTASLAQAFENANTQDGALGANSNAA